MGPIDLAVLDELREQVGAEFTIELIDTFLEETPGILSDLRSAAEIADADGYRRAAHSLKANGVTFGAAAFASLARDAELSGVHTDPDVSRSLLDAIDAAYAAAATCLQGIDRG